MLFPELKEWDMGKALDNIAWNPTVVVYDKSDLKAVSRQDGWKDCFRVRYNGTGNLADAVVAIVQEGEDPRYNAFVEELREKFQRGCRGEDVFFGYEDVPDVQCKNLCMNISAYLNGALTQARETPGFPDVEEIVVGVSLRRTNATLIDHNPQFGPYNLYRELVTERAVRRFHQALVLRD